VIFWVWYRGYSDVSEEYVAFIFKVTELGWGGWWWDWEKQMCWLCRRVFRIFMSKSHRTENWDIEVGIVEEASLFLFSYKTCEET